MKVLVIGSGPIVIGQAAEFDYAGTQACKALREEGHGVVLINSNPATIMTDPGVADALYIEPLNVDFCERVIARERPDALLPTLGGQTGLNLATQLSDAGILEKYDVKLLGTPLSAIRKAEDREQFRDLMREIKEPVPESWIVETPEEIQAILDVVPYPCIIRPAYTLGGTGGGVANTPEELLEIGLKGLKLSMRSQLMIERSLLGWKEVEYEVMRDRVGNCITVCNMENFDPMGVHTGDSIVVAPSQTLSDIEYHMLRTASLKIIQALGIEGGCNVQLAVNPESFDYYIIEVNPRVSRSSALASKATGYPIARVAAKIAVGRTLDEIDNQVTGTTKACFEPALDYCVVKIPRWPFDKFASGDRSLFTQMKATGEVMAIDRTFEAAFMKAIRGLEVKQKDLRHAKFRGSTGFQPVSGVAESSNSPERTGVPRSTGFQPVSGIETGRNLVKRVGAHLPHWTQDFSVYHVVFRLADSMPKQVLDSWREERDEFKRLKEKKGALFTKGDEAEYQKGVAEKIDRYLDSGAGSCVLKDPAAAEIVESTLRHFDGDRYLLHAWAVMPNHVHVVVQPIAESELADILRSWKSFSSNEVNKALGLRGPLWQIEYYDHLIRNEADFANTVRYVQANLEQAGITNWPWASRAVVEMTHDGEVTLDARPVVFGAAMATGHGLEARATGEAADSGSSGAAGHGLEARATTGHGLEARATGMADSLLQDAIRKPTDERLWAIAEGLRRGWTVDEVYKLSRVDRWFLQKIQKLLDMEDRLERMHEHSHSPEEMNQILQDAFLLGYPSPSIESIIGITSELKKGIRDVREETRSAMMEGDTHELVQAMAQLSSEVDGDFESGVNTLMARVGPSVMERPAIKGFWQTYDVSDPRFLACLYCAGAISRMKVMPVFKMVDTCAGEFESQTPYYYGTFEQEDDAV